MSIIQVIEMQKALDQAEAEKSELQAQLNQQILECQQLNKLLQDYPTTKGVNDDYI